MISQQLFCQVVCFNRKWNLSFILKREKHSIFVRKILDSNIDGCCVNSKSSSVGVMR